MYKIGPLQRISNVHGKTISQGRDVHGQTDNYKWSGMYMKGPFHKEGRYTHRQTITKDWKCTWTDNFTGKELHAQTDRYKGSRMYMDRQFHREGICSHYIPLSCNVCPLYIPLATG